MLKKKKEQRSRRFAPRTANVEAAVNTACTKSLRPPLRYSSLAARAAFYCTQPKLLYYLSLPVCPLPPGKKRK
jgi:hypothetical protein